VCNYFFFAFSWQLSTFNTINAWMLVANENQFKFLINSNRSSLTSLHMHFFSCKHLAINDVGLLDLLSGKLTEELLFATRTSSHFTIAIMLGERVSEREEIAEVKSEKFSI
jgi:hypothetical protein